MQIQPDELHAQKPEDQHAADGADGGDQRLEPEAVPHALEIAGAVKLRRIDAGTGKPAEDCEIKHKQQLTDNRDSGHCLGAAAADHHMIDQPDGVRDAVLNHDRDSERQRTLVNGVLLHKITF